MTFRSATAVFNQAVSASVSFDPGLPAGAISSDTLYAVLAASTVGYDCTAPAGWVPVYVGSAMAVYRAPGSVASTAFTRGSSSTKTISAVILAFSGRNTSAPVTSSSFVDQQVTGGGFFYTQGTAVTSAAGDDVLVAYATQFPVTGAAPTGYTDVASLTAAGPYLDVATTNNVVAGSTGVLQHNVTSGYGADSVVIISLAAGGSPPSSYYFNDIMEM